MLLAGDIGGTKTNLALFKSKDELRNPVREGKYPSAQYPTLESLVAAFLHDINMPDLHIDRAVFGVAGPVVAGSAKITNLPWRLEEGQLQRFLNIPSVSLLNDLAAMAYSIPLLSSDDVYTLNKGKYAQHGTIAVVSPGTGLGEAMLTWDGTSYRVHPSEGGHADFAPTNALEVGLLVYMLERKHHVSYEHVCSGIGLPNIYSYLKQSALFDEPSWLAEQLASVDDHTPVIVNAALSNQQHTDDSKKASICDATLRAFVTILGAECGNMALKVFANGGIYLGGGIPPRILSFLQDPEFIRAFKDKGRFTDVLLEFPVHVILNNKVGLIGSASFGFSLQDAV